MEYWDNRQNRKKKKRPVRDILLEEREDRRLLPDVPDITGGRSGKDRRGGARADKENLEDLIQGKRAGIRYHVDGSVWIYALKKNGGKLIIRGEVVDISMTGLLVRLRGGEIPEGLVKYRSYRLQFEIEEGDLPEGLEMKVKNRARLVRFAEDENGRTLCGFEFVEDLDSYAARRKGRYMLSVSALLLFLVTAMIILMRAESVIYFKFNKLTYFYSIVAAMFLLSRYLFGALYRPTPVDPDYTPGVTIIIPCFNEEEWIQRTILSCMNQYYPPDKLEVIVVDDCSTDHSVEKIQEIIARLKAEDQDRYNTRERISCIVQEKNAGKREALVKGTEAAKNELVVFVDSDSFLDPYAILHLVQPFKDPKMGGVAGRTDVANTYTNSLTKMQSVRYYISFRILKAAEGLFDCVTCLSGPIACYRRKIVMDRKDEWLNQRFFGQKATFGDDRSMTNFVLREYRTGYQDTAVCSTIVPNKYSVFLRQQMRWKRSWLRETLMAGKFMWKKEPFASINFYIGMLVPILAPIIVLYNLIYVPLTQHVFPKTFLMGILLMSLLMSFAQLFLRRSRTWVFGLLFCFYYEAVLLWQMPVAWLTFWKSTWGTRMTPSDVAAQKKKERRRMKKQRKRRERKGEAVDVQD